MEGGGEEVGNCGTNGTRPYGDVVLCSHYNYVPPSVKLQIIKI